MILGRQQNAQTARPFGQKIIVWNCAFTDQETDMAFARNVMHRVAEGMLQIEKVDDNIVAMVKTLAQ